MPGKKKHKSDQKVHAVKAVQPGPPHVVGIDWIEVPVRRPVQAAVTYCAIGFVPRHSAARQPRLAIGGTVIALVRSNAARRVSGLVIQAAVDDVNAKRRQLSMLGLKPGALRRLARGDRAFEWRDPDGHVVRFVGPARRPDDKVLR